MIFTPPSASSDHFEMSAVETNDILIDRLAESASQAFHVNKSLIFSKSRVEPVKYARWCCWKLMREAGYSLKQCGELTGGHHYASVINAMEKIDQDIRHIPYVRNGWNNISKDIKK